MSMVVPGGVLVVFTHDQQEPPPAQSGQPAGGWVQDLPLLRVQATHVGEPYRLRLLGELDLSNADQLTDCLCRLCRAGHQHLVLDLSGLEFCDAAGLNALLQVHNRLRAAGDGSTLSLTGPRPLMARMLAITGLDEVLPLSDPDHLL